MEKLITYRGTDFTIRELMGFLACHTLWLQDHRWLPNAKKDAVKYHDAWQEADRLNEETFTYLHAIAHAIL